MTKKLTKKDLDLIEQYAFSFTVEKLAARFDVHPSYMKQIMISLGCYSPEEYQGYYTASSLSRSLGVSHETVRRWIHNKGLPFQRIRRHEGVSPSKLYISIDDFWKWAKENQDILSFRRVSFDELSPAPRWAREKKKSDWQKPPKQKKWNFYEESRLLFLYHQEGLNQSEIAAQLNRTLSSVEKKIKRMTEKQLAR